MDAGSSCGAHDAGGGGTLPGHMSVSGGSAARQQRGTGAPCHRSPATTNRDEGEGRKGHTVTGARTGSYRQRTHYRTNSCVQLNEYNCSFD